MSEESYPEWLNCLQGESPLLSRQDWMFIAGISSQIAKEIKSKPKICDDEGFILKEKLSVVKNNFEQVVNYLKLNRTRRQYFIDTYPKWQMLREFSITNLRNIGKSIQEVRENCQTANIIGSFLSLVGGGILFASGLRGSLLASAMVGLGSLTSFGTPAVELSILREKIEEAEKILKRDKECSEHLWEWLSDSTHLKEALDNIRSIDVDVNFQHAASVMTDACKKNRKKTVVENTVTRVFKSWKVPPELADEISQVIGILIATSMLYDRYRPLFDLSVASVRLSVKLNSCLSWLRAAVGVSAVKAQTQKRATEALKKRIAVGMTLDVVNLLLACDDSASKSEHAEKVNQAAGTLEKEAKIFRELYLEVLDIDDVDFD